MDDVRLYRKALADDDMTALAVPGAQGAFEITNAVRAPNGASVTLKFRSRANRVYAVDYSTSLKDDLLGGTDRRTARHRSRNPIYRYGRLQPDPRLLPHPRRHRASAPVIRQLR